MRRFHARTAFSLPLAKLLHRATLNWNRGRATARAVLAWKRRMASAEGKEI